MPLISPLMPVPQGLGIKHAVNITLTCAEFLWGSESDAHLPVAQPTVSKH